MVQPTPLQLPRSELSAQEYGLNSLWAECLTHPDGQDVRAQFGRASLSRPQSNDADSTKMTAYLTLLPKESPKPRSLRQNWLSQKLRLRRLTMALMGGMVMVSLQMGTPSSAIASAPHSPMPTHSPPQSSQFQTIEQPFWVKAIVTAGGLSLIGLELWWFLFNKPSTSKHMP